MIGIFINSNLYYITRLFQKKQKFLYKQLKKNYLGNELQTSDMIFSFIQWRSRCSYKISVLSKSNRFAVFKKSFRVLAVSK